MLRHWRLEIRVEFDVLWVGVEMMERRVLDSIGVVPFDVDLWC